MTSTEIRRSFLDFFRSKEHTIVPSSSLLPDSPNLLFTNAGMNQFVPIFLGTTPCPYTPPRAADTQKCIRAGGKHNDLEDVGLDTYHHTFFEMLGNWSFGDYFKKEAIQWAWELLVDVWGFPPERLYATVYQPDKTQGDPADFDSEAHALWSELFRSKGLNPDIHVVPGNKKDNFWMMGETGPCGPCSELHVDLTQNGDTKGRLVNQGSSECIEIWNLVFIQFNANPDGSFVPLPACHVDTGMGFERVASILQCTKNFTDFGTTISNYETDIFRPYFAEIEKLTGRSYRSTLPRPSGDGAIIPVSQQEKDDVAFRVIADHLRTLGFAIADGIQPGNSERHYVLRRILRRAVRYGRTLGLTEPFLHRLTPVLVSVMGEAFPELRTKQDLIAETLKREEVAFNKTLDKGLELFEKNASLLDEAAKSVEGSSEFKRFEKPGELPYQGFRLFRSSDGSVSKEIAGAFAFKLYDEQGFPLDLTELLARERGLTVDTEGFETLMEKQRARARAAQKKEIISLSALETTTPTEFSGFENLETVATVLEVVQIKNRTAVILDRSVCYAEMGGQLGDTGTLHAGGSFWPITDTQKSGPTWLHFIEGDDAPFPGTTVTLSVNPPRRAAIQRHHSVTHLLHWALREVLGDTVSQKGSFVGPEKLTFDFASSALMPDQLAKVELLVNERILENASVSWKEVPFSEVKGSPGILQFFGDKYGNTVRVVQIGGTAGSLDGYSMELCGGTHVRATGEIGLFRIASEAAVAAGVRRIEAIAGLEAYDNVRSIITSYKRLSGLLKAQSDDLENRVAEILKEKKDLEKAQESWIQREGITYVKEHLEPEQLGSVNAWIHVLPLKERGVVLVQSVLDGLKTTGFKGIAILAGEDSTNGVQLGVYSSPEFQASLPAGKLISAIAPLIGGKGGGKSDSARGGGRDASGLPAALAKAKELIAVGKL